MKLILISGVAASAAVLAAGFAFAAGRAVEASHERARLSQPDLAAGPRAVQAPRVDRVAPVTALPSVPQLVPRLDALPAAKVARHAPRPVPRNAAAVNPMAVPAVTVAPRAFVAQPSPPQSAAPLLPPATRPAPAPVPAADFALLPQIGVYR